MISMSMHPEAVLLSLSAFRSSSSIDSMPGLTSVGQALAVVQSYPVITHPLLITLSSNIYDLEYRQLIEY